ncbi:I78 family peptidase inhibitor [Sulfitobacter sp. PR48]|jgi:hypothetical protein|uniref:I78 family peptidase inhibitor n=1 Tax=Sulfitobacter porphyrae TaxID=1246864 RepID=A0ABW2B723_9RHOB|nr:MULTISPECIES: I78 family peptidase inhibitor [unclassified Sulfitobacter]MCZ4255841.1 I78 family peptidase inhibitor [Sulfitobacter sp. G21635-S1]MDD9719348.1 I78 family peptidase inhibitor [Sulfitobacter sp. PR48]GLT12835.1 hypothetical protein GCM10007928_50680 [Sulfitobacter porphyrae]
MKTQIALVTAAALAACGPQQNGGASSDAGAGGADTCNAAAYAGMIGQDAVVALSIPDPKRQYRLGDPVTMDFNASRVNIVLNDTDVIIDITCG